VAWISILAVMFDVVLALLNKRLFPWAHPERAA
jgi:hypothetical protein